MKPAFHSWTQFVAMGGYSFYVWLSVAATLMALLGLMLHTTFQRRTLLKTISLRQAREQRILSAKKRKPVSGEFS